MGAWLLELSSWEEWSSCAPTLMTQAPSGKKNIFSHAHFSI